MGIRCVLLSSCRIFLSRLGLLLHTSHMHIIYESVDVVSCFFLATSCERVNLRFAPNVCILKNIVLLLVVGHMNILNCIGKKIPTERAEQQEKHNSKGNTTQSSRRTVNRNHIIIIHRHHHRRFIVICCIFSLLKKRMMVIWSSRSNEDDGDLHITEVGKTYKK